MRSHNAVATGRATSGSTMRSRAPSGSGTRKSVPARGNSNVWTRVATP